MAGIAPDALVINRVYTRETGDVGEDPSIPNLAAFDIVVEWSAGRTANNALGVLGNVTVEIETFELNHPGDTSPQLRAALSTGGGGAPTNTDGGNHDGTYEYVLPVPGMGAGHAGHMFWSVVQLVRAAPPGATADFGQCMFHIT